MNKLLLTLCATGWLTTLASGQTTPWKAPDDASHVANPIPAFTKFISEGKDVYTANCVICHGVTGMGDGPAGSALKPPAANLTAIPDQTDGALFWKITTGRPPMLAFKDTLTDKQRWEVISYIRTLKK